MDIQPTTTPLTYEDFLELLFQYNHLIRTTPTNKTIIELANDHFKRPPHLPLSYHCDSAPPSRRWTRPGDQTPKAPR
jgi:hypothetical protein